MRAGQVTKAVGVTAVVTFFALMFAAWITHVVASIQTASWVLLVIGIFVPPIGWIHGFVVWLT